MDISAIQAEREKNQATLTAVILKEVRENTEVLREIKKMLQNRKEK